MCHLITVTSSIKEGPCSASLTPDLLPQDLEPGTFDTITCFSVTKWVHLNGGDEALQALLAKVYSLLAPGGRFILEPQQWVSYKKAVRKPVSHSFCCSLLPGGWRSYPRKSQYPACGCAE